VSGVMTAAVSLDLQLNETYFVVAHLHYVLLGINVFPVIGGIYYWFPKFTGRMTSEVLGRWAFAIMFIGFNVAFFPMHLAGLLGMPRRIYTYSASMGWNGVNMISTLGSFLFAAGILLFLIDIAIGMRRGRAAGSNPWDAPTLEWAVASPPPAYNFAVVPLIESRHPLWEDRLEETQHRSSIDYGYLLDHGREALGTTALDAAPDVILKMPGDAYSPFFTGLFTALIFAGMLLHWWVATGTAIAAAVLSLTVWMWPRKAWLQRVPETAGESS
jgi:heme/copper-type cytochrome/quinol oxidase subunit 1